ncbi:hypothetical protein FVER14953_21744 [Fusarium verticillioides]|nr:hypothetical protein FVER14953_21744 [Fusarium verticillioides]
MILSTVMSSHAWIALPPPAYISINVYFGFAIWDIAVQHHQGSDPKPPIVLDRSGDDTRQDYG